MVVDMIKSFRYLGFLFLMLYCSIVFIFFNRFMLDGLNNIVIFWFFCGFKILLVGVNENIDVVVLLLDCYRESRSIYFNKGKRVFVKLKCVFL